MDAICIWLCQLLWGRETGKSILLMLAASYSVQPSILFYCLWNGFNEKFDEQFNIAKKEMQKIPISCLSCFGSFPRENLQYYKQGIKQQFFKYLGKKLEKIFWKRFYFVWFPGVTHFISRRSDELSNPWWCQVQLALCSLCYVNALLVSVHSLLTFTYIVILVRGRWTLWIHSVSKHRYQS